MCNSYSELIQEKFVQVLFIEKNNTYCAHHGTENNKYIFHGYIEFKHNKIQLIQ